MHPTTAWIPCAGLAALFLAAGCGGPAQDNRRLLAMDLADVLRNEALKIEDLGSTNGTAVNGTAVPAGAPAVLQAGSRLRVGDVELLVRQV